MNRDTKEHRRILGAFLHNSGADIIAEYGNYAQNLQIACAHWGEALDEIEIMQTDILLWKSRAEAAEAALSSADLSAVLAATAAVLYSPKANDDFDTRYP